MEEPTMQTPGQQPAPAGEAMPAQQMPTPEPMPMSAAPQQPMGEPAPMMPQQPVVMPTPEPMPQPMSAPQVERMEMPMQPVDLSGQSEMPMAPMAPEGGNKKKWIIIAIVVVAGLAAGVAAFFIWRAMSTPAEEMPAMEQPAAQAPVAPVEQVVVPPAPEADDISVIEQELNAANSSSIDTELQSNLTEISGSL